MALITIYRDNVANQVFVARGTVGTWPFGALQAVGNGEGLICIRNKARAYHDESDFFEITDIYYDQFCDEGDIPWGTDEQTTVDNLNALFENAGAPEGTAPVFTSPSHVQVTQGHSLNFYVEATNGVSWEWGSLPAGLAVANNNKRHLLGQITEGVGTYDIDVTAVNYYGSTTQTLQVEVVADTSYNNTKSVQLAALDYMEATESTDNPFYRLANSSGSQNAWSASCWFKPGTRNKFQTISYFGGDDRSNEASVRLYYDGGQDRFRIYYGSQHNNVYLRSSSNYLGDGNTWWHVLFTFDGGTTGVDSTMMALYYGRFNIYVNGVSDIFHTGHSNYGTTAEVKAEKWFMGKSAGGSSGQEFCRDSNIDEFAVWDSDQGANVSQIYNGGVTHNLASLPEPPLHYYRMGDDATYPTIHDVIGDKDFTMHNMSAANILNEVP